MTENKFKCAECLGVFEKGWSDEEALASKETTFPDVDLSDCALVCEDCYQKIMGAVN